MPKNKNALKGLQQRLAQVEGMSALIAEERAILVTEETAAEQVAEFIRQSREEAGLSQAALGRRVGVTQARISQIEQGKSVYGTSFVLVARLLNACGVVLRLSSAR